MQVRVHRVKEFEFPFEALPGQSIRIKAETEEEARAILRGKLKAMQKEIAKPKAEKSSINPNNDHVSTGKHGNRLHN